MKPTIVSMHNIFNTMHKRFPLGIYVFFGFKYACLFLDVFSDYQNKQVYSWNQKKHVWINMVLYLLNGIAIYWWLLAYITTFYNPKNVMYKDSGSEYGHVIWIVYFCCPTNMIITVEPNLCLPWKCCYCKNATCKNQLVSNIYAHLFFWKASLKFAQKNKWVYISLKPKRCQFVSLVPCPTKEKHIQWFWFQICTFVFLKAFLA